MDQRAILFVPDADTDDRSSQVLAGSGGLVGADIVVTGNGAVVKDRHGDAAEVLMRLRSALSRRELSEPPSRELLGCPMDEIEALTLDGAHWLEVFGHINRTAPLGGPVLRFQVAQAPGGKSRKLGIGQGDSIAVRESAVVGVQRTGGEPVFPAEGSEPKPATGVGG